MKLVIDKIGMPDDLRRAIVNLDKEIVKRVIDTFDNHDDARNEKYEQIKKKDNYWSSDRDRFVGRFFKKYVGKNFILMDKEIIAYHDTIDDCKFYLVSSERGVAKPMMDEVTASDVINTFMTT